MKFKIHILAATILYSSFVIAQDISAQHSSGSSIIMYFLPLIMVVCGIIIWSIRQEGDIKANRQENANLRREFEEYKRTQESVIANIYSKHDSLNSEIAGRILDTNKGLSKVEGKLDALIAMQSKK